MSQANVAETNFGPMIGNQNARRGLLFNDQIRKVLNSNSRHKLVTMVNKLVDMACAGDLKAIEIVLDRVDGKANQSIDITARRGNDLEGMTTLELQAEIVKRAYLLTNQAVTHSLDPSPDPAVLEAEVVVVPAVDRGE